MTERFSRRAFLQKSAVLTAALAAVPHARVLGANDDVRVAVVGFRGKGMQHIGVFKKLPGVRVVALCDVDKSVVASALEKHFKDDEQKPKIYSDVRKLLEDKEIDAVCVATPNHWHAPIAVWACQAGKDVYVEKPCSHTFWEGRQIINAAKKYNRIVQVGTQSRSDPGLQQAFQFIKDGNLGPIEYVRGIYYNIRQPIGKVSGPQQPPPGVDYDLWLGPSPEAPLLRKELHYDWHWQWPYGNGELGNNGVHMLDLAMWVLGIKDFPSRAMMVGGRFLFEDDSDTPNTQIAFFDYKPVPVLCELRNLPRWKGETASDNLHGHRNGVHVKCRDGYYVGYAPGGWVYDSNGKRVKQFVGEGGKDHHQNFIDAVRSRKAELIAAPPEAGHLAAGLCHLGNISYRLGEAAKGEEIQEAMGDVAVFHESVDRFNEHLLMNGVDVLKTPRVLGPWLSFDSAAERFTGEKAEEANALLRRSYRAGFEIPEQV